MKKTLIIYMLLIGYLIVDIFIIIPLNLPFYNEIITPIIWILLCIFTVKNSEGKSNRTKKHASKAQSVIIAMIFYIILYYILGLIFGYQRTPYSKEPLSILKNVWAFGSVVFLQEFARDAMVRDNNKSIIKYIVITILFAAFSLSFAGFASHFTTVKEGFIYSATTIVPSIVASAVLTYLVYVGGPETSIMYRLFIVLPELIIPVIPALDWFLVAAIGVTLPVIVFVYMNYVDIKKEHRLSKRERRKYNPIVYVPVFAFLVVLVGFVTGLFKYQPIAVLSGSMSPTFNRGDAVVVKKLTTAEKDQLKVNDIIQFTSGTKYVVHRIVDIDSDMMGNRLFITKGDFNNAIDLDPIKYEQVVGKATLIIPYIGYPSVWLSGMVH